MYKGVGFFAVSKEGRRERENDNTAVNSIELYLKFWCERMKDAYILFENTKRALSYILSDLVMEHQFIL